MRLLVGLLLSLALVGCHHHHEGDEDDGGVTDDGGAGVDAASTDLAQTADMASCPSQILCGDVGACCDTGQECVDGQCLAACASGVRCDSGCCNAGQVCLSSACVTPTTSCQDSFDCADKEFCEPTLDECLPEPTGTQLCEYKPPVSPYEPEIIWSWGQAPNLPTVFPTYGQVINTPSVVDLDQDGIPDVVIVSSLNSGTGSDFEQNQVAYLRALDGKTGVEKWPATADVYAAANVVNPRGTPAVADIDGDGKVEIVVPKSGGGVLAFNHDGSLRWSSTNANGTAYNGSFNSVTVAIADMDHDGKAEIVLGGVILDYTGKVVAATVGREHAGENASGYGAVSIIADVDGDGVEDVVTGQHAWKMDGSVIWDCTTGTFCGASAAPPDGYTAIADFDLDGHPELVVIANGTIRIQNAKTGAILTSLALPGSGHGGPPTIADFDGDGHMDIASANGNNYNVFRYSTAPPTLTSLWSKPTQDLSSNVTGSSVFDFEGDGKAEVVYNDECYLRVYSGVDGTVKFQTPSSSATIHEFPILVDVNADNHTELVVVSNDRNHLVSGGTTCPGYGAGDAPRHGVFVYGDTNNKWVRTRRLWNEHAYHVSNINSDGTLPEPELASWVPPAGLNNYRVSTQGAGVFNAPDLAVDLQISTAECPTQLDLVARVKNQGSLGVEPGIVVDFYAGTDATGTHLGTLMTTMSLLPGASELVTLPYTGSATSFYVVVDGTAAAQTSVPECDFANNGATASNVACPTIN